MQTSVPTSLPTATRRRTASQTAAGVLLVLALAGCSFAGRLTDASASSSAQSLSTPDTSEPSDSPGSPSASSGAPLATTASTPPPAAGSSTPSTSPAPSATQPPATSATSQTAPALARCTASQLTLSLGAVEPAAGQRYSSAVLTNSSGTTCSVRGYGGVELTAGGAALPGGQQRLSGTLTTVQLAPGQAASAQLHWTVVPGTSDSGGTCPTPDRIGVIPPNDTAQLTAAWTLGPVCDRGKLQQSSYARA